MKKVCKTFLRGFQTVIKTDYTYCIMYTRNYTVSQEKFQFAAKFWCIDYSSRNNSIVLILGMLDMHYMDFSIAFENDPL